MKRRNFIFTPFLLVAGNSLFARNSFANSKFKVGDSLSASTQEVTALLKKFRRPLSAAAVGKQYLHDNPSLDEQKLIGSVGLSNDSSNGFESDDSVHQLFASKKAHDFEVGNILCLNGWVLSEAEVSLCALAFIATLNG